MRVTFSSVEEFLAELALDAHLVEDGIVRVTLRYQPVKEAPVVDLSVVAGGVINGKVVEVHHQIGSCFWPPATEQEQTLQTTAREVRDRIVCTVQQLNLTVRAGVVAPYAGSTHKSLHTI